MGAEQEESPATGIPEPQGHDPGDRSRDPEPHHTLGSPASDPDPTEWPDPYDRREDPRDPPGAGSQRSDEAPHPPTGAESTSEPNPKQDLEAAPWAEGPKRDKVDD